MSAASSHQPGASSSSTATSLPHLPMEVQTLILLHLSTLSSHHAVLVSRISRLYHALTLPILYSRPLLSSQKAVEALRRSLVERPSLVQHFTSLAVISGNQLPGRGAQVWGNDWVEVVKPGSSGSVSSSKGKQTWDEVRSLEPSQPAPPRLLLTMGGETGQTPGAGSATSHLSLYAPSHFQPRFTTQIVGDRILRLVAPRCRSLLLDRHFFYDLNGGLYAARSAEEIYLVGLKDPLDLTGLGSGMEDEARKRAERSAARLKASRRTRGEASSSANGRGSEGMDEMRKALAYRRALRYLPLRRIEIAHSPSTLLSTLSSLQSLTHIVITYPELPPSPPSPHLMSLRVVPRSAICLLLGLGSDGLPVATADGTAATNGAGPTDGETPGPGVEADTAAEQAAMSSTSNGVTVTTTSSRSQRPRLQRLIIRANAEVCARIADELRPIEDDRLRFRVVGLRRRKRERERSLDGGGGGSRDGGDEKEVNDGARGLDSGKTKTTTTTSPTTATATARWEFRRTDFAQAWSDGLEALEVGRKRRERERRERKARRRDEVEDGRAESEKGVDELGRRMGRMGSRDGEEGGEEEEEEEEEEAIESDSESDEAREGYDGDEASKGQSSCFRASVSPPREADTTPPLHAPWADEADDVLGATAQGAAWLACKADEERVGWRWVRGEDVTKELEGLGTDGEGRGARDGNGFGRWWF